MTRPSLPTDYAKPKTRSVIDDLVVEKPNPFLLSAPPVPIRSSPFRADPFGGGGGGRPPINPFRSAAGSPFGNRESRNPFQPKRQVRKIWTSLPPGRRPRPDGPGTRWIIPLCEVCEIYEWETFQMYVGDGENFDTLALVKAQGEECTTDDADSEGTVWCGSARSGLAYLDEDGEHCHGMAAVRCDWDSDVVRDCIPVDFESTLEMSGIPADLSYRLWKAFVPEFRAVREFAQDSVWDILTRWGGAVALPVMRRVGYNLREGGTSGHELMDWFGENWETNSQLRSCWGDFMAMTGQSYIDDSIYGTLGAIWDRVGKSRIIVFDEDELELMYWRFPDDSDNLMPIQGWQHAIGSDYYSCFDEGRNTDQPWVICWRELEMEPLPENVVQERLDRAMEI